MPLMPNQLEKPPPAKPHLALLVNERGQFQDIPPGAHLWIVEDPESKIFPLILKSVSSTKLVFTMVTPEGQTDYVFKLHGARPKTKRDLDRILSAKR